MTKHFYRDLALLSTRFAMAVIIRFPKIYRPLPEPEHEAPLSVRVLSEGPEHWVICDDQAWLFGDLRGALTEAVEIANELNIPIQLDR
jgi:hypothetical protein